MTRRRPIAAVAGWVFPSRHAVLQVRVGRTWRALKTTAVRRGRYRFGVERPGLYRVRAGRAHSDAVRIR